MVRETGAAGGCHGPRRWGANVRANSVEDKRRRAGVGQVGEHGWVSIRIVSRRERECNKNFLQEKYRCTAASLEYNRTVAVATAFGATALAEGRCLTEINPVRKIGI